MEKAEFGTVNFTLADNVELEMVDIPAYKGTLEGVQDEKMAEIRRNFMMGKYPVTQEQYEAVMGCNPSVFKGAKRPVENVTWAEAKEFCEKLNEKNSLVNGRKFNLPTQFQWDYVAKSRGTVPFEDEEAFGEFAWFEKNADGETHEVGLKAPSPFGLYDLYGNVNEWCDAEWENAGKPGCPTPLEGNAMRVALGGNWNGDADVCVKGVFLSGMPEIRKSIVGFRVAIVPGEYTDMEEEDEEYRKQQMAIDDSVNKMIRMMTDCPEPEDYENLPEEVFDPAEEDMHGPYKRYMYCDNKHAVIKDNTAIVNVYNPMQVTVYRNHKYVNVYGNNVHADVMSNDGYIRFCSNNAQVTVSGNGVVDVMGHGNEVTVMDGTVHVYGEKATVWISGGVVDVHGVHSKVVVFNGKATVRDHDCQELHCGDSGELLLPDNSKIN
ncbi:MAG: formylglycine-generating enzyme family protein [Lentisphaeria bacterium]|nr:formylglycine-generating enzyme family protein [Lentisphaeria bacterium]